jgi:hypothetical protein
MVFVPLWITPIAQAQQIEQSVIEDTELKDFADSLTNLS